MRKKFKQASARHAVALVCTLGIFGACTSDSKAQTIAFVPMMHNMSDLADEPLPSDENIESNAFLPLMRSLSDRLDTAKQVALSKWDSAQAVYNPVREAQVLKLAASMASDYGLTVDDATALFSDQIEANKQIQYALLNDWRREGAAPLTPRDDLSKTVRPKLDSLQKTILLNLQTLGALRQLPECQAQVALAVGQVAQEKSLDVLGRAALDRSAASLCLPPAVIRHDPKKTD